MPLSDGAIAGIVVGVVIASIVIYIVVGLLWRATSIQKDNLARGNMTFNARVSSDIDATDAKKSMLEEIYREVLGKGYGYQLTEHEEEELNSLYNAWETAPENFLTTLTEFRAKKKLNTVQ